MTEFYVAARAVDLKEPPWPSTQNIPCTWCLALCSVTAPGRAAVIARRWEIVCAQCAAAQGDERTRIALERMSGITMPLNPVEELTARGAKVFTGPRCSHQNRRWTPVLRFRVDGRPAGSYWVPAEYCEPCTRVVDAEQLGACLSAAAGIAHVPGQWTLQWIPVENVAKLFVPKPEDNICAARRVIG